MENIRARVSVSITDGIDRYYQTGTDLIVNHSPALNDIAESFDFFLAGSKYFLARGELIRAVEDEKTFPLRSRWDILLLPGGNLAGFFSSGGQDICDAAAAMETKPAIRVAWDMTPEDLYRAIRTAGTIVTACGNTLLEVLALGRTPVVIQTAADQQLNYMYAIEKGRCANVEHAISAMKDGSLFSPPKWMVDHGINLRGAYEVVEEIERRLK